MRTTLSLFCLIALLAAATPAQAQLRDDLSAPAPTAVYENDDGAHHNRLQQWLSTLFSDEHFQMTHSYEMSFSSFGGESTSLGMYTNTMQFRFNDAWAARVDVSVAQDLFGGGGGGGLGLESGRGPKVFLRNAEVSYQPNENMQFRLHVRQSPYGRYAAPSGRAGFRGLQHQAFLPRTPLRRKGYQ